MTIARPDNVITLKRGMEAAERGGYALGAFSPRVSPMIRAALRAGKARRSPLIVQIAHGELTRHSVDVGAFAEEFYAAVRDERIDVPVMLHLDHTKQLATIAAAIEAGFTSVMIDASEKPLEENIAITREVVEYAHARGVSVEAELGMIGTTDFVESEHDEELYTDPQEAERFVRETGADALAVSVGTAHGVYLVRQPRVDYERLMAIRSLTPVHLVLHGGSGVPPEMMLGAIRLPGGGVSKVNIATDLELALLAELGRETYMSDAECRALPAADIERGRAAVQATVEDKMVNFLASAGAA